MNIVKRIDQYEDTNIFFCEPTKNNVINEGNFIRILYSNHNFVLNGIYLLIPLNDIFCEKYYTKYKCCFNTSSHSHIIQKIQTIEENILKKYQTKNKQPQFKLYEQMNNGNFKIFTNIGNQSVYSFVLKISGIWETQDKYGLTYKFSIPFTQII
jgi:hypothetical protein